MLVVPHITYKNIPKEVFCLFYNFYNKKLVFSFKIEYTL